MRMKNSQCIFGAYTSGMKIIYPYPSLLEHYLSLLNKYATVICPYV